MTTISNILQEASENFLPFLESLAVGPLVLASALEFYEMKQTRPNLDEGDNAMMAFHAKDNDRWLTIEVNLDKTGGTENYENAIFDHFVNIMYENEKNFVFAISWTDAEIMRVQETLRDVFEKKLSAEELFEKYPNDDD